jgi:hypothetical protein
MDHTFKKKLATLFNDINKDIFSVGVHDQKIEIQDGKIIIFSRSKRIAALDALMDEHSELVYSIDYALSLKYKKLLKQRCEQEFGLKITALFRDYDPGIEQSCTVICYEK